MKRIFPRSFYNTTTLAGLAVSLVSIGLILFLVVLEALDEHPKPYIGILAFIIVPMFLILGVLLIFVGAIRERKRMVSDRGEDGHLPRIDMNDPKQRRTVFVFSIGTIVLLLCSAFGSFKAYEYTDSDQFCGEMCHKVMEPEYTAYQYSPHAHVGCAQCHIGSGADWFVKAKLSGSYQVYSVLFNKYSRPIGTPVRNLRPAQQTCEQCHWPRQFYSNKQIQKTYFMSDSANTKWSLNLLVKIGGGNDYAGPTEGIHWHMNIANEVSYVATDTARQVIPWIRIKMKDGSERTYKSTENPMSDSALAAAEHRRMDCIDCHNRPTHIYHAPQQSVNNALASGWISPSLPFIKTTAVQALEGSYSNKERALDSIKQVITGFYNEKFPQIASTHTAEIQQAVGEVQKIYSRNYFPEMQVSWKHFPDNIGHVRSLGCFRCHDGKHVTDDGKVITKDCAACHTIIGQQNGNEPLRESLLGLEYRHPADIGDAWKEMNCSECHNANQ